MTCPANPPPPKNARVLADGEVTPKMQAFAALHANSNDAIGSEFRDTIDSKPIIAWVNWHTERWNTDGTKTPGCFHSVTLYLDLAPPLTSGRGTDWKIVVVSGVAVTVVVGGFALMLKYAGRAAAAPASVTRVASRA